MKNKITQFPYTIFVKGNFGKLSDEIKHAFTIETSEDKIFEDEAEFLEKLADKIARRRLSAPAILFLETFRPVNYISNQTMVFFRPFLTFIFPQRQYDIMSKLLEKRESMSKLVTLLEKKQY